MLADAPSTSVAIAFARPAFGTKEIEKTVLIVRFIECLFDVTAQSRGAKILEHQKATAILGGRHFPKTVSLRTKVRPSAIKPRGCTICRKRKRTNAKQNANVNCLAQARVKGVLDSLSHQCFCRTRDCIGGEKFTYNRIAGSLTWIGLSKKPSHPFPQFSLPPSEYGCLFSIRKAVV